MSDLISRQAALDALDRLEYTPGEWATNGLTMCKDAIKALPPAQPGWISVTERLPEDAYGCLVTVHYDNYYTGEHDAVYREVVGWDGETWNDWSGLPIDDEVVAWMPLPTPYREGGQDDG